MDNRRFVPTELGEIVNEILIEYFPEIVNVDFTAKMERDLDLIEEGKAKWIEIIDNFYKEFEKRLKQAEEEMKTVEIKDEPAGIDCEKCGSPMVYKMGRYGKFIACSNFPECRNAKPILKKSASNARSVKKAKSSNGNRKRIGAFYGCERYPECEFVSWDKPIPRNCPKCDAYLVEKRTKKKVQVLCSNCDYEEQEQT